MISTILIVDAGQAGAQAVDILRGEGFAGRLLSACDEPHLPYQRPPLSKKDLFRVFRRQRARSGPGHRRRGRVRVV